MHGCHQISTPGHIIWSVSASFSGSSNIDWGHTSTKLQSTNSTATIPPLCPSKHPQRSHVNDRQLTCCLHRHTFRLHRLITHTIRQTLASFAGLHGLLGTMLLLLIFRWQMTHWSSELLTCLFQLKTRDRYLLFVCFSLPVTPHTTVLSVPSNI